jgi:O-antigen ligase
LRIALSPVEAARWLIAGVMIALLFSPPVTVAFELMLYGLMLGSATLRARLWAAARHPLPAMALAFWLLMALALLYSIAPWREAFGVWWSWRRLLLLVFAAALFDDPAWKARLVRILIWVAALGALASYLDALIDLGNPYVTGIVFGNHAIQSMVFALAAFAAALRLKHDALPPAKRVLLVFVALMLSSNVVLVTTARSGYAALIVLGVILAYHWPRSASRLRRLGWTAAGAAVVATALFSSPMVQQRVTRGLHELANYDQGTAISPIGERVIYIRNATELAVERPLFGHGTGAFREAYARKVAGRSGREGLQTKDPHNAYLSVAVQQGLVGLAVFLALLGVALRQPASMPFRLLALSGLAAWCVTSLFNGHFYTFAEGRFIWLWLGALLASEAVADR